MRDWEELLENGFELGTAPELPRAEFKSVVGEDGRPTRECGKTEVLTKV